MREGGAMCLIGCERGSAVFAAVGIMLVLTILGVGAFTVSQNTLTATGRERNSSIALAIADAGIDQAVWRLDASGSLPSSMTVTTDQGSAEVSVTALENSEWQIVSRGHTNVAPGITRAVKVSVFSLSLWNFVMASSLTAGGGGLVGNTSVYGPFYVRGGVTLSGNSEVQKGPFFVKDGDISLTGNGKVGTTTNLVYVYNDGNHPVPGSKNFYVKFSNNCPDLYLPPMRQGELQALENLAATESADCLMGSTEITNTEPQPDSNGHAPGALAGYYKIVDTDRNVGTLGAGSNPLVINATTPSWGVSTHGSGEDFAWDQATRTLYVKGTVFVDGPVTFGCNINYEGNGALVANGNILVTGLIRPVGPYPNDDVLGLVTPGEIRFTVSGSNDSNPDNADIWGAYFATNQIRIDQNVSIRGSMLTGLLNFAHPNGHLFSDQQLPEYLPESMPGSTQRFTYMGSWREVH
ncbi:MAG: hypothetical protein C4521_06165 [Actinobacteria bacterium]|nr:MAG: hypothetical protein C4521_06165 [Actinomycetota bacterium]